MDTLAPKVLSPRNRNISQSTGLAKFKLSPKKPALDITNDICALQYESPRLSRDHKAEMERKASFYKARSVFDGSPVKKSSETVGELRNNLEQRGAKPKPTSPFRPSFAVERVSSKVEAQTQDKSSESSRNDLLFDYAAKQTKLLEIERQKKVIEFELLELEAQIHKNIGDRGPNQTDLGNKTLRSKVSTLFKDGQDTFQLKKTASTIFSANTDIFKETPFFSPRTPGPKNASPASNLKKTASSIFTPPANFIPNQDLKKKASAMLNNKFMNDVREKLDQQQNDLEEFTKKGTEFARNFLSSLSTKKEPIENCLSDSSFMVDNLGNLSIADRSVLLSDDEYEGVNDILYDSDLSVVHIDDCDSDDSDEEKENY